MNQDNPCLQLRSLFTSLPSYSVPEVLDDLGEVEFQIIRKALQQRKGLFKQYKKEVLQLFGKLYFNRAFPDIRKQVKFEQNGRVVVEGDLSVVGPHISYFPGLIRKVEGDLFISQTKIEHLDYLEEAENIYFRLSDGVISLKNLRLVKGDCEIKQTRIKTLPSLEKVAGKLDAQNLVSLKSLPALESAGSIDVQGSRIENMLLLEEVEGGLDISLTPLKALPLLETVGSFKAVDANQLKDLRSLFKIGGDFVLMRTSVEELPVLDTVNGDFVIEGESFQRAPLLHGVNGKLKVIATSCVGFPKLTTIFGDFSAAGVDTLVDLGSLRFVGGYFIISGTGIEELPELKTINGFAKLGKLGGNGFRQLFPKLSKLNKSPSGVSLYSDVEAVKQELQSLIREGKIVVKGRVK
jgi:hypothetical protein